MIKCNKKLTLILSTCGIIVLSGLFIMWIVNDSNVNKAGYIAAFASTVLFAIICIKFLSTWINDLFDNYTEMHNNKSSDRKTDIIIFALFLIVDIVDLIIIHIIRVFIFHDTTNFIEGLNLFLHIDTGYYLKIAEQWYVTTQEYIYDLVFFPGYPIIIRIINTIFNNYLISATVASAVFYAGSAVLLYKLLLIDYSEVSSRRGLKFFAILPATFFFSAPMSESVFVFFSLLCIYLMRNDKWVLASFAGAMSAFTRSLGVLILAPMLLISISGAIKCSKERSIWIKRAAISLIVLLGLAAYLLINYYLTGDAFKFSHLQKEKWNQSIGLFFDTTAFQIDNALADITQPYYVSALGIWFPNVAYCFSVLLLMAFSAKSIRAEYSLWFICYYAVAIGATYLISAPRYLVACVPVYPALVSVTENKKVNTVFTILFIISALYYIFAFAARWEVF